MNDADGSNISTKERGSDMATNIEVMDTVLCDVCVEDGESVPVDGFCEDCNDYLCEDCKRHHRKNRLSRNHRILDSQDMPKQKKQTKKESPFELLERCQQHGIKVSYICVDEDVLCCEVCKITYHNRCDKVHKVTDISHEQETTEAFDNAMKELVNVNGRFECVQGSCEAKTGTVECLYNDALGAVTDTLRNVKNADLIRIASVSKTCESALQDISSLNEYLASVQQSKTVLRQFVATKIAEKQMKKLSESVDTVEEECNIAVYGFTPNTVKAVTVDKGEGEILLGKLVLQSGSVPYSEICVKSSTDQRECAVTDLCMISLRTLFVVDNANNKVKLVDTKKGILTFELQLLHKPRRVTRKGTCLIVTQSGGQIQMMTAALQENTIRTDSSFQTSGECVDIAYMFNTDTLAVSFVNPHKVQIMDLTGTVLKTIREDTGEANNPIGQYAMIEMNDKLFLLDRLKCKVSVLGLEREIKEEYTIEESKTPTCIVKGPEDEFLVSYPNDQSIYKGLKHGNVVLQTRGLPHVFSMAYKVEDGMLFVGTKGNTLKRYILVNA